MKRTMKDLAEELGISRTTVSLVLKGKADQYRISRETQKKILDLVEKENFRPNFFAQGLNRGNTRTVGVIFPDVFEDFMVKMIRGIGEVLEEAGYTMILMTSRFSLEQEKRNMEELARRGCDGILLVPCCAFGGQEEDRSHLKKASPIPLVQMDRISGGWKGSSVVQDDRSGGERAAAYLKEEDCRSACLVSLNLTASSIRSRIEGFAAAWGPHHPVLLDHQDEKDDDLKEALEAFLATDAEAPGFFVTTAGLALRVTEILAERDRVLGRDYRLIRFGEDPRGYDSGMAGIGQPHYEMGRSAARQLMEQIGGGGTRQIILPLRE